MDADDEMSRLRRIAAQDFRARRGELGMSQREVALKSGIAERTIQDLESRTRPRWPQAKTMAALEAALGWPAGELERRASAPRPLLDHALTDRTDQLNVSGIDALIERLQHQRKRILAELPGATERETTG